MAGAASTAWQPQRRARRDKTASEAAGQHPQCGNWEPRQSDSLFGKAAGSIDRGAASAVTRHDRGLHGSLRSRARAAERAKEHATAAQPLQRGSLYGEGRERSDKVRGSGQSAPMSRHERYYAPVCISAPQRGGLAPQHAKACRGTRDSPYGDAAESLYSGATYTARRVGAPSAWQPLL